MNMLLELTWIAEKIADGNLLPTHYYRNLDWNAALDERNGDSEFDADWVRLWELIEYLWLEREIPNDIKAIIEEIRRESFMVVSLVTSQHEIASYV